MNNRIALIITSIIVLTGCAGNSGSIQVTDRGGSLEIHNNIVKAELTRKANTITSRFYSKSDNSWQLVAESFTPPENFPGEATQLFNTAVNRGFRFLVPEMEDSFIIEKNDTSEVIVKITGRENNIPFSERISLKPRDNKFHITVEAAIPGDPPRLDYLMSSYTFNIGHPPFFVHTPGLKFDNEDSKQNRFRLLPGRDQVIGDRAFHSPAVILQDKGLFMALVPDLDAINRYAVRSPDARRTTDIQRNIFSAPIEEDKYTMPTGLDLNVQTGLTEKPVVSFGFMDNIIAHHIRYQRVNDSSMIRTLESGDLRYEFDLFVSASEPEYKGFQEVSEFQWKEYGHRVFMNRPHLAFPFSEYLRIVDSITFNPIKSKLGGAFVTSGRNTQVRDIDVPLPGYKDMGSWLEFEMNGLPVGGYRSAIPWWHDVMHNSNFWNNARDASGFYFWGQYLGKPELIDRAHRIINFCLQAPRNEKGLFATLYNVFPGTWSPGFTDPVHGKEQFFLRESGSYEIPALSKTGAHLLDYYFNCEKDERIVDYLRPYADWLITVIDERGSVPSYVTTSMESSPILLYSAQPAASMWFLASFGKASGEEKYVNGAERIAGYLEKEIIPEAKWTDMEQYFSCGKKPLDFVRDRWQNMVVRGNLANIWACEGFAALYKATGNKKYLELGEQAIDYLSFSQSVWEPHYIYTAFPFGGFTADNADNSTMLDARQAETVKPYIWYGRETGRQDLIERGIAAARSSVVLLNLPEHKANNIYRHTNIYPYGLGPENIDHEAHPQSAMRTHPSWGEGSGVFTGLAEALRGAGGLYINTGSKIAAGVDGLRITRAVFSNNSAEIDVESFLSNAYLRVPWTKEYTTTVMIDGNPEYLIINGQKIVVKDQVIRLKVLPGKYIQVI